LIEKEGYGEYFVHSLGHGVGLDIHEPPALNPETKDKLKVGNVVTVEPGIYITNFGGIRIEDTVLVGKSGAERLTEASYVLAV
jgi:Xaa-Pro aminopeptidase